MLSTSRGVRVHSAPLLSPDGERCGADCATGQDAGAHSLEDDVLELQHCPYVAALATLSVCCRCGNTVMMIMKIIILVTDNDNDDNGKDNSNYNKKQQ